MEKQGIKISVPSLGKNCGFLVETDFDEHKIPAPPGGYETSETVIDLLFKESEEAIKYGLHLGDVHDRMAEKQGYECAQEKLKLIIKCINEQADFKSLVFPNT